MDTLIKRDSVAADGRTEHRDQSIIVGARQLHRALNRGGVDRVFLARDADPAITGPLEQLSLQTGVECIWVEKMIDLGSACGIDVGAAAAAVAAP